MGEENSIICSIIEQSGIKIGKIFGSKNIHELKEINSLFFKEILSILVLKKEYLPASFRNEEKKKLLEIEVNLNSI